MKCPPKIYTSGDIDLGIFVHPGGGNGGTTKPPLFLLA